MGNGGGGGRPAAAAAADTAHCSYKLETGFNFASNIYVGLGWVLMGRWTIELCLR